MKEVFEDFAKVINNDPRLSYISRTKGGGGVLTVTTQDQIYTDKKTPFIVLMDGGAEDIRHFSSRRRWIPFILKVVIGQKILEREAVIKSSSFARGVEAIAKDVRNVIDMERCNGKYARNFLRSEAEPEQLVEGNVHLVIKTLTFELVRIE